MKRCPECQQTYIDDTQTFCVNDGARLSALSAAAFVSTPVVPPIPETVTTPIIPLALLAVPEPSLPLPAPLPAAPLMPGMLDLPPVRPPSARPPTDPIASTHAAHPTTIAAPLPPAPAVPLSAAVSPVAAVTTLPAGLHMPGPPRAYATLAPPLVYAAPQPSPPAQTAPPLHQHALTPSIPPVYGAPYVPAPVDPQTSPKRGSPYPVGAILLVLLVVIVYQFGASKKQAPIQNPPESPVQTPGPTQPPIEAPAGDPARTDESALKSTILLADDAVVHAMSRLDTSPLYQVYTGDALQTQLKTCEMLKSKGLVAEAHLDNQEIQSYHIDSDGSKAEVKLVETWSITLYSSANRKRMVSKPAERLPQTLSLMRGKEGWLIYASGSQ